MYFMRGGRPLFRYWPLPNYEEYMESIQLSIRGWHHVNEQAVTTLSILANLMLFLVVINERNETLRPYARVLLQNCVVDVVYTVINAGTEMQIEFWDGFFVLIMNGEFKWAPMIYHYVFLWFWVFMCACAINISPIMFYFRYVLVCKSRQLNVTEMLRALVLPIGCATWEAYAITSAVRQDGPRSVDLCSRILNHPMWDSESVTHCMVSDLSNVALLLFICSVLVIDLSIYGLMAFYSYKVYRTMRNAKYSQKAVQMQRQMNWMLFTQMVVPLFTAVIPVAAIMIIPIVRLNVRGIGIIMCACISWIPLVSPLTTMVLVSNFRRRAIRYVFFFSVPLQRAVGGNLGALQAATYSSQNGRGTNTRAGATAHVPTVPRSCANVNHDIII